MFTCLAASSIGRIRTLSGAVDIAKSIDDAEDAVEWAGQLSAALIRQRKWDLAESWNRQAYTLQAKLGGPDQAPLLKLNAADIAAGRGKDDEATQLYCELIANSTGNAYLAWNTHMHLGFSTLARRIPRMPIPSTRP